MADERALSPELFSIVRDVVMLVIGVLVFYWGRDRQQLQRDIEAQFALRDLRLDAIDKWRDRAGEKTSDLASRVQALVGCQAVTDERLKESEADRRNIWALISRRTGDRD